MAHEDPFQYIFAITTKQKLEREEDIGVEIDVEDYDIKIKIDKYVDEREVLLKKKFYSLGAVNVKGENVLMSSYKGKVLLIVNLGRKSEYSN